MAGGAEMQRGDEARLLVSFIPLEPVVPEPAGLFSARDRRHVTSMRSGAAALWDLYGATGNEFVDDTRDQYAQTKPLRAALSQPFSLAEPIPPLQKLFPRGRWVQVDGAEKVYVFIELERVAKGAGFFTEAGKLRKFQLLIKLITSAGRVAGIPKSALIRAKVLTFGERLAGSKLEEPLSHSFQVPDLGLDLLPGAEEILGLPVQVLWAERSEFVGERVNPQAGALRGTTESRYRGAPTARMMKRDVSRLAVGVRHVDLCGIVHRMRKEEPEPADLRRQAQHEERERLRAEIEARLEEVLAGPPDDAGPPAAPGAPEGAP